MGRTQVPARGAEASVLIPGRRSTYPYSYLEIYLFPRFNENAQSHENVKMRFLRTICSVNTMVLWPKAVDYIAPQL